MRLVSYSIDGRPSFGAVVDGGIVDLRERLGGVVDVGELLARGWLPAAREVARGHAADVELGAVQFERTVPWPSKILCIGVNYGGRAGEYADGGPEPARPSVFVRFPGSLVGHDQALLRPPESEQLDYEGEIVAIVGRRCRRVNESSALDALAGLTIGNEGTIRDWVRHGKFNVTPGKNWESSGSIGPWMTTMDEVGPLEDLRVTTTVNGQVRQDDVVGSMAFPIASQVAYLSTFCTLEPGDLIFTGTPTGSGARLDPPAYLRPGDVVEVTVTGLGTLRNRVRDEAAA